MGFWLNENNLAKYVRDTYGPYTCCSDTVRIPEIDSFLQSDYEGDMDCTLVSLMTVCWFFNYRNSPRTYYDELKAVAKKYFYTDNIGTQAIFINAIANKVFKKFNIAKKSKSAYLKNVGWHKLNIMQNIKASKPVILSLWKDGRDYYRDHTVTCIGYTTYTTVDGKIHFFIEVYDNWNRKSGFIDYDKLSTICSINYFC